MIACYGERLHVLPFVTSTSVPRGPACGPKIPCGGAAIRPDPVGTLRRMPLDETGDEGPHRPPPDPLDRPWVHPSELGSRRAGAARARPPTSSGRWGARVGLALAAGVAGALATLVVLAVTGALDDSAGGPRPGRRAVDLELATRVEPSVVGVTIAGAGALHRVSGVCVGAGYVLTSSDAVEGATGLTVATGAGRSHPATLIGRDPETDLALVKVDATELRVAEQHADGSLHVGDSVVALGMGDDSRHWATTGVVSSLAGLVAPGTGPVRTGLVTTDAVVGADAPGGALLDRHGRLVGILITARAGNKIGIAVPLDVVRDVTTQLRASGKATHGWLGVGGSDASDRPGGGIRVTEVVADSPAARGGLVRGDVITAVNGAGVPGMVDLLGAVRQHHPGDRLELDVWHDGATRHVSARLSEQVAGAGATTTTTTTSTITTTTTTTTGAGG